MAISLWAERWPAPAASTINDRIGERIQSTRAIAQPVPSKEKVSRVRKRCQEPFQARHRYSDGDHRIAQSAIAKASRILGSRSASDEVGVAEPDQRSEIEHDSRCRGRQSTCPAGRRCSCSRLRSLVRKQRRWGHAGWRARIGRRQSSLSWGHKKGTVGSPSPTALGAVG
jgi:hypothetical protein